MAVSDGFKDFVLDQLASFGPVTAKRMFGGAGLYHDGLFFGLLSDDRLFLRVDDQTRPLFEAHGMGPFQPFTHKPPMVNYHQCPDEILEDADELASWSRAAWAAARKAAESTRGKRGDKRGGSRLRNIGPKSRQWLAAVGVKNRADLERLGAVACFLAVRQHGAPATLSLLWALQGALTDRDWRRISAAEKVQLRRQAGLDGG